MNRHGTPRGKVRYELLVGSYGGGQDSTAILYRWIDDPDFRAAYSLEWGWDRRDAQMFMFSTGRPVPCQERWYNVYPIPRARRSCRMRLL
ncbi:MAG: hypothetical protein FOGNACKC_00782 [Anaerolineae bacterium]|nr:hypothetical protein [Anaerolineae bacterium]